MNTGKPVTPMNRTQRERELRAVYSRMQSAIDASRHLLWEQFFHEVARINPHGSVEGFIAKFDEAWRRSLLPSPQRDDMDAEGNYLTPAA